MVFFFGSAFEGKVKKLNNQWIETKFLVIFIPIFPLRSMLVTSSKWGSRQGIEIPLNRTSVIALYARMFFFLNAIVFWISYFQTKEFYSSEYGHGGTRLVYALIATAILVYFCFFFGRSTKLENEQRNKIGKAIGLYTMPEWLFTSNIDNYLVDLKKRYSLTYPESDWKKDLMAEQVDKEKLPTLYAIALFSYMWEDNKENEIYYNRAYEIYN